MRRVYARHLKSGDIFTDPRTDVLIEVTRVLVTQRVHVEGLDPTGAEVRLTYDLPLQVDVLA